MKKALSFDDVLISPKFNTVDSRKNTNVSTTLGDIKLKGPIIAANMPTICEEEMAKTMVDFGLGIIHRMNPIHKQREIALESGPLYGGAVGIGQDALDRAEMLVQSGCSVICIDVAHGHQERVLEISKKILSRMHKGVWPKEMCLIIGNIATSHAANYFCRGLPVKWHKKMAFKVGVGGGSLCSTRVQTGCGVPTFQSVLDIAQYRSVFYFPQFGEDASWKIIADGGIKTAGDIAKSLAAGADAAMVGSLLAGSDETPGPTMIKDGHLVKAYRGAASASEKEKFFGEAEYVEGAETYVPVKGKVSDICSRLIQGLQSAMTYVGARNILEFQRNSEFIEVSPMGYKEGLPHGLF